MELIALDGCEVTDVGLRFIGGLSRDKWIEAGVALAKADKCLMWLIGDWILAGESNGIVERGRHAEACELVGIAYPTAKRASVVARAFERDRRRSRLGWSAHAEVANRDDADEILEWAYETNATVAEIRQEKNRRDATTLEHFDIPDYYSVVDSLDDVTLKYGTVYADPPWQYGNQGTRASTDNHYQTMTVDDICAMPIKDLASDNAHLHLWTTNAFLFDAKRVMEAWGFEYRSVYVWVKPQMGIGNYWRVSHEFLLLGIRGNAKRFNERNHMSWGSHDRAKHSQKPEAIRKIIERVSPGPFLELFGRKPIKGWTVFGNQIDKGLFNECVSVVQ